MSETPDPAAVLEQSQWDYFWVPSDTVARERTGLSYLSSPHDLPHLNAVLRTEPTECDVDAALSEVSAAHRGVVSRWHVYSRIDREALRRALSAADYAPRVEHDARVIGVADYPPRAAAECRVTRVADTSALRDFHAVANAAFELDRAYTDEQLEAQLRQCEHAESRIQRFVVYSGERAVSCGGLNAFPYLGFGLLWAGSTLPQARGHGFYSALVSARVAWAKARALSLVGLYARSTTSSPITAKQGFVKYGTMTHWERSALTAESE